MNDTTAADQPRSQSEHGSDATDKPPVWHTPPHSPVRKPSSKAAPLFLPKSPLKRPQVPPIVVQRPPPHVSLSRNVPDCDHRELLAGLPHKDKVSLSRPFSLQTLNEYVKQNRMTCRKRKNVVDVQCFRHNSQSPSKHLPIVVVCPKNTVRCDLLKPGEHGCLYSASPILEDVVRYVKYNIFHLMTRTGTGERFETGRYLGVYSITSSPLPVKTWLNLEQEDRTSVCTFEKKLHGTPPDVTARAYDTRKRQLSIFVLENHEFDSQVFQALMNIEATLIIPVAQPQCLRRQTPDWKTLHEELSDENE